MTEVDTHTAGDPRDEMHRLIEGARDRASLEALRTMYSDRLHRQADDFDATAGLSLVHARLQQAPSQPPLITSAS